MTLINSLSAQIFAASAIAAALASCSSAGSSPEQSADSSITSMSFNQDIISGTHLYRVSEPGDDAGSYYLTLQAFVEWPKEIGNFNLKPLQDSLMRTLSATDTASVMSAVSAFISNTSEWSDKAVRIDSIPPYSESDGSASTYELYSRLAINVTEVSDNYITMNQYSEMYGGGAHPMHGSTAVTYCFTLGRMIDRQWLFKPGTDAAILPALTDAIVRAAGFDSETALKQALLVDSIPVTDNVSIQQGMIVFHYNCYEILPYSSGETDAMVSPYEVRDALTPEAIKFFGLDQ